ncbi:hypothetical protein SAMN06297144_1187 [Sphingomonas guangdongensis]|uniref:CobQ/CobB/MinD/ParA nucleotide binding domain-containing protein n=1 Tax=Sphingomonas guangdongensis TaxID=1141890 RepID=A0A285QGU0_9SPHN|nr:hypothetical protein [Sphingomonas guangdongensis]SOB80684.1 hypothetical protein SAMN06297144_1187 [Sphingomonas guangdongensis]
MIGGGEGLIASLYSYKGGVGRTMAVANVAFLAAMNGLAVLAMDWDLEAPGLPTYFRGLMRNALKDRKPEGLLDAAWEWKTRVASAEEPDELEFMFEEFESGAPFERRVEEVFRAEHGPGGLDLLTAGSPEIGPEKLRYEEALAHLSWNSFIDEELGGAMIESLRRWAKRKYDLVLIDSRTGFADVAGVCTMQLPDVVALCFVLNRQNIEGVSRVAAAIKAQRGSEIQVRAVPMRLSRVGTAEEEGARARAMRELERVGRLNHDDVERDMRTLAIMAEPNVPFVESLAPFNARDPRHDTLTADYARLTKELLGREIAVPIIDEAWRANVNSWLKPTLSTNQYVSALVSEEPVDAMQQLTALTNSAVALLMADEEISTAYARALVDAMLAIQQRGELVGYEPVLADALEAAAELARGMHGKEPDAWRPVLADLLERAMDIGADYVGPEGEIIQLEEIDELLAAEPVSPGNLLRRARIRKRIARLFGDADQAMQQLAVVGEVLELIRPGRKTAPPELLDDFSIVEADALLIKGDALLEDQPDEARSSFARALRLVEPLVTEPSQAEPARLSGELNYRLMNIEQKGDEAARKSAAKRAIAAAAQIGFTGLPFYARLPDMVSAVIGAPEPRKSAGEMLRFVFGSNFRSSQVATYFSRAPRSALRLVDAITDLILAAAPLNEAEAAAADQAAEMVEVLVSQVSSRRLSFGGRAARMATRTEAAASMGAAAERLAHALEEVSAEPARIASMRQTAEAVVHGGPRLDDGSPR